MHGSSLGTVESIEERLAGGPSRLIITAFAMAPQAAGGRSDFRANWKARAREMRGGKEAVRHVAVFTLAGGPGAGPHSQGGLYRKPGPAGIFSPALPGPCLPTGCNSFGRRCLWVVDRLSGLAQGSTIRSAEAS
jgi:hypothetical protein